MQELRVTRREAELVALHGEGVMEMAAGRLLLNMAEMGEVTFRDGVPVDGGSENGESNRGDVADD